MLDAWAIEPSGPLRGEVQVRGSKNEVTKHMVAALLGRGPSTITNVPEVGDVDITAGMLCAVGATVDRDGDAITVVPPSDATPTVPLSFSGLNRIPASNMVQTDARRRRNDRFGAPKGYPIN